MLQAGLIGNPVAHSRSPFMHNAAFAALGIEARYELWHTELVDLPDRVAALRAPGMLGANVTVPHKQAVIPFCDQLTETARRAGAVNTIIPQQGRLLGDNTDVYGFVRSVQDVVGQRVPAHAMLLGAGGAARGVIVALEQLGVARITIVNRTISKADELARDLATDNGTSIATLALEMLTVGIPADVDLLINSTSIGWQGDELPIASTILATLGPSALVADLTYRETALLKAARGHGNPVMDGAGMLLYQGARAFELWTGRSAPVEVMRAALLAPASAS